MRNFLFIVIIVAVILRLATSFIQGTSVQNLPGIYDQISYHTLGERVTNGFGFTFSKDWWPYAKSNTHTAFWSYFYTIFLAITYRVFGINPLFPRIIQAVLAGFLGSITERRVLPMTSASEYPNMFSAASFQKDMFVFASSITMAS